MRIRVICSSHFRTSGLILDNEQLSCYKHLDFASGNTNDLRTTKLLHKTYCFWFWCACFLEIKLYRTQQMHNYSTRFNYSGVELTASLQLLGFRKLLAACAFFYPILYPILYSMRYPMLYPICYSILYPILYRILGTLYITLYILFPILYHILYPIR